MEFPVAGRDEERLVDAGNDAVPEQRRLGDDGEGRVHLVAIHAEIAVGGCGDDTVLRSAIQVRRK
jgi:hypothetical protein